MNRDIARAERNIAVLSAARGWHRAALIDRAALDRVAARYPDDRRQAGPAMRVLFCLFAAVAGIAGTLLVASLMIMQVGLALAVGTGAFVAFTELARSRWRWLRHGAEEATASLAVIAFTGAAIALPHAWSGDFTLGAPVWILSAVAALGAVWRWGLPPAGALVVVFVCAALHGLSQARLATMLAGLALAIVAWNGRRAVRLAPSQRTACAWGLVTALAAAYVAVNVYAFDHRWLWLEPESATAAYVSARETGHYLAAAATALFPVVLLAFGVRRRDKLLVLCAAVAALLSLVTLRQYVHIAPLWAVLTAGGLAAIGLALGLRRWLASGPGGERFGFTLDDPLGATSRRTLLEAAVAVAAAGPAARAVPPGADGSSLGDGRFGGGGASGDL